MFGGMFDGKVAPPMGAWVALKFAQLIDPAITYDIYSERPWILSPVFCSMNIVDVRKAEHTWEELESKFGNDLFDHLASLAGPSLSDRHNGKKKGDNGANNG